MSGLDCRDDTRMNRDSSQDLFDFFNGFAMIIKLLHHPILLRKKQNMVSLKISRILTNTVIALTEPRGR